MHAIAVTGFIIAAWTAFGAETSVPYAIVDTGQAKCYDDRTEIRFPPGWGAFRLLDVHGAGAQRSDPKAGNPQAFPRGRGPQGDVIRINNFVRCVRQATTGQ